MQLSSVVPQTAPCYPAPPTLCFAPPAQVADPEMLTMMELFSNPDNQALLKAKKEEMKDVSAAGGFA